MAVFYGQVKGRSDTVVSRLGTKKSGIRSSVQSYDGSVITRLTYNEENKLMVEIETSDNSSTYGRLVFAGTLKELEEKLTT